MRFLKKKIPPPIVALLFGLIMYFSSDYIVKIEIPLKEYFSIIFLILGMLITFLSARNFRIKETTVNPLTPDKATSLVTDGMFKISRNPMYLGLTSVLIALSFYKGLIVGIIFVPLFMLYITIFQIIPEEEAMLKLFGDEYKIYSSKVRRWI